jgi:hypothetical protein
MQELRRVPVRPFESPIYTQLIEPEWDHQSGVPEERRTTRLLSWMTAGRWQKKPRRSGAMGGFNRDGLDSQVGARICNGLGIMRACMETAKLEALENRMDEIADRVPKAKTGSRTDTHEAHVN